MKKFLKWFFITLTILFLAGIIALSFYIGSIYTNASKISLDNAKLAAPFTTIEIFDNDNKLIKEDNAVSQHYAEISTLSPDTINAFISIEDKNFYQHHGVNYKRIVKAMINNLKAGKFKEGASTITQQLIKNSHLTSDKTFERKITEIALSKKLEKQFSKDEILQQYLNIIYFGNNCYGIENAAQYYFSCPASELNLQQSALLAGLIKSPSKYSPIKNPEKALERRNLVLSEMEKDGNISSEEALHAKNQELGLMITSKHRNKLNSYSQAAIDEAEKLLHLPAQQIALQGYKIYTYQNEKLQTDLEKAILKSSPSSNYAGIVIDNKKHSVVAYNGDGNYKILECKRQPGSCIKPILVYAPALNEDIIYPCTQLLDEKTDIAGFSPKNVGNSYHGYVSARESLSKSYNIPAVKILSYVGIDKAKKYAQELGVEFDEKDEGYCLALGGMTYGVNIAQLAGAYTAFANNGIYAPPKFISFIADKNGKIVYTHSPEEKQALREDSCYLLTDMLKTCTQSGTGKKLEALQMPLASKTGTVGKSGSKQNLDAWNISYSPELTCGVWLGNLDNTAIDYTGGNQPTEIVKDFFEKNKTTEDFERPSSIVERKIDTTELEENHRIVLANNFIPERYTKDELFSLFNLPKNISKKFAEAPSPIIKSKVENDQAVLVFSANEYMTYQIYDENDLKSEISNKNGEQKLSLPIEKDRKTLKIKWFYTLYPEIEEEKEIVFVKTKAQPQNNKRWYI